MKKKILALLLIGAMLLSSIPAFAVESSFSDVDEENYGWAIEAIEDMTTDGIIKGYTDGTFRPAQDITKMESLILSARVLGFTKEENAPFVDYAAEKYADVVAEYDINYKDEVAYLLYKGVLTAEELEEYIGEDEANAPLLRYEAAILLTKVMKGEELIDEKAELSFVDTDSIPKEARPYVAYVKELGLMGSMSTEEEIFEPEFAVNRVQMAVILYRIMGMIELSMEVGTLTALNTTTRKLTISMEDGSVANLTAKPATDYLVNGEAATINDLVIGEQVAVILYNHTVEQVETFYEKEPEVLAGKISGLTSATISLDDIDTGETAMYKISSSVLVTVEGKEAKLTELDKWFYAEIKVNSKEEVIEIHAEPKTKSVSGTVVEIKLNPVSFVIEYKNGETEEFLAQDTVTVKRNGLSSSIDKVGVGDEVSCTLNYRRISNIVAESENFTVTGTIKEIVISQTPSVTIAVEGIEQTYYISREAKFVNVDSACTIYDLRLGATVKLKVEGVTAVEVTMQTTSEPTTITGVVESYNSSYRLLNVVVTDEYGNSTSKAVYLKKSNATTIVIGGKTVAYTELKAGMTVTVFGATSNGAFEAETIVVQ